jgi:hypothetical protein
MKEHNAFISRVTVVSSRCRSDTEEKLPSMYICFSMFANDSYLKKGRGDRIIPG